MKRLVLLVVIIALLGLAAWKTSNGPLRGILVVGILFLVVGSAIAWLTRASLKFAGSGKDPSADPAWLGPGHDGTPHGG